jgi:hypothetical protein
LITVVVVFHLQIVLYIWTENKVYWC